MKAGQTAAMNKQLITTSKTKGAAKETAPEADRMNLEDKLMSDLNSLQYPLGSRTIKIEVDSRRR